MAELVTLRWGPEGGCTINLRSSVFNLTLTNWKKLMRLIAKYPEDNKTAVEEMHAWFMQELSNPQSVFRYTKKEHEKLYRMYRTLIFKGDM
jgi:hypothetical protein